jgi:hypothetical protein
MQQCEYNATCWLVDSYHCQHELDDTIAECEHRECVNDAEVCGCAKCAEEASRE